MTALSQRRNSKLLFLPGKMLLQCLWLTTFLIHNYMYVMAVQQTSDNGLDDVIESLKEGLSNQHSISGVDIKQILDVMTIQSGMIGSQQVILDSLAKTIVTLQEKQVLQASIIEKQDENIKVLTDNYVAQSSMVIEQSIELKELQDKQKELELTTKDLRRPRREQEGAIRSHLSKRILLHSDEDILSLVTTHSTEIQDLQNEVLKVQTLVKNVSAQTIQAQIFKDGLSNHSSEIQHLNNDISTLQKGITAGSSGSTYTRWGRKSCPDVNGTDLVYSGFAAGSYFTESGGAANYICLSPDPDWGHYNDSHDAYGARVYGAEYQSDGIEKLDQFLGRNVQDEDVPCSVCRTSRPTVIMIPGKNQCYKGWTLEYHGYLSAGNFNHAAASEYVCLDNRPDVLQGGHPNNNGALIYIAEGRCGSLPCPPYIDGRELTCVVCSK